MNGELVANRAEVLTPPGAAALAVVRISGPDVAVFLARHFSKSPVALRAIHGELRDATENTIDDPVVVLAPDGRSAEICLHGGPWVVQATLNLLADAGFQNQPHAGPAFAPMLPATDLRTGIEAFVMHVLPRATTELGLRALFAQVDAWIDFGARHRVDPCLVLAGMPVPNASPAMQAELRRIRGDRALHWLLHPPKVAIVGPANAGKSTLVNVLLGQERSIVADLPGTTRDWVGETADLDGLPVVLIDTPGIRNSDDEIESRAIQAAERMIASADLVVLVLDATRPLQPDQQPLVARFAGSMRVINKCDGPPAFDLVAVGGLNVSAKSQQGVDALINAIHQHFGVSQLRLDRPRWFPDSALSASEQSQDVVVSHEQEEA